MSYVERTMIVPAALTPLARALGAGLSSGGAGMFTAALSPTGAFPATHYVSAGAIGTEFDGVISSGEALHAACVAAGAQVTREQCDMLVEQSEIVDQAEEGPFETFARLGLQLCKGEVG